MSTKKQQFRRLGEQNRYYIPVNPSIDRIVPWKVGEQEALASGISARKHRETADRLWLARRNQLPGLAELEQVLAPPQDDPLYAAIMIAIRNNQARRLNLSLPLGQKHASLASFALGQPRENYVADFIREELVEKGWKTALDVVDGDVILSVDFTQ